MEYESQFPGVWDRLVVIRSCICYAFG